MLLAKHKVWKMLEKWGWGCLKNIGKHVLRIAVRKHTLRIAKHSVCVTIRGVASAERVGGGKLSSVLKPFRKGVGP